MQKYNINKVSKSCIMELGEDSSRWSFLAYIFRSSMQNRWLIVDESEV